MPYPDSHIVRNAEILADLARTYVNRTHMTYIKTTSKCAEFDIDLIYHSLKEVQKLVSDNRNKAQ